MPTVILHLFFLNPLAYLYNGYRPTPAPLTALTKNGMGVGEEKWCGAGEDFGSGQPGLCGKVISAG